MQQAVIMKQVWTILLSGCPFLGFTQDTATINADTIFCGNTRIVFYNRSHQDTATKISFVHVHENETTAVTAANAVIDSLQKGCFTTWQCQQQRYVDFEIENLQYHFDPNRIYSTAGMGATLRSNGGIYTDSAMLAVKQVADEFVRRYIDSNRLVVALHNNTDAGGLTINSYQKGGTYYKDAKLVFVNSKQDADDFFYTTELVYYNFLKRKGFNIVLQDNVHVHDDGSLSVYCATHHIPYINIEAQEGHLPQQIKMLGAIFNIITGFSFRKSYKTWSESELE